MLEVPPSLTWKVIRNLASLDPSERPAINLKYRQANQAVAQVIVNAKIVGPRAVPRLKRQGYPPHMIAPDRVSDIRMGKAAADLLQARYYRAIIEYNDPFFIGLNLAKNMYAAAADDEEEDDDDVASDDSA